LWCERNEGEAGLRYYAREKGSGDGKEDEGTDETLGV
jgi:hypothetical protein